MKLRLSPLLLSLCVPLILGVLSVRAQDVPPGWGIFATPIHDSDFDPAVFAEWIDGTEKPIINDRDRKPRSVLWVQNSLQGPNEIFFGYSQVPGPRHLRVGFLNPVPLGGILVSGDVKVAVLKPTSTYPGDLNDESQWLSGVRIEDGKTTSDEVEKKDQTALWIFPPRNRDEGPEIYPYRQAPRHELWRKHRPSVYPVGAVRQCCSPSVASGQEQHGKSWFDQ